MDQVVSRLQLRFNQKLAGGDAYKACEDDQFADLIMSYSKDAYYDFTTLTVEGDIYYFDPNTCAEILDGFIIVANDYLDYITKYPDQYAPRSQEEIYEMLRSDDEDLRYGFLHEYFTVVNPIIRGNLFREQAEYWAILAAAQAKYEMEHLNGDEGED